jgi:glycine oxidase
VKAHDVAIIGGGIIGLSLALELRRQGASVVLLERGEPGRESSHAAAGMLAFCDPETPSALQEICFASARLYPGFVHDVEDESGHRVDFRQQGTIAFYRDESPCSAPRRLTPEDLHKLEPCLAAFSEGGTLFEEQTLDNRALTTAAAAAARHRGVEIASGAEVTCVELTEGRATGVRTARALYAAQSVVNCAGAWAGRFGPLAFPTGPKKGQMLSVAAPGLITHAIRGDDVYLVPRSDGRVLIGATVEDVGFDKRVDPAVIQRMHQAAANLVPSLGEARILEAWAGLRPGTPDGLPILGATSLPGYFAATGHFRNGILLAPITARLLAQVIAGKPPELDITAFSPARFAC